MKTIPILKRHCHVVRVGIFLIAVLLTVGIPGCTGTPGVQIRDWYDLDSVRDNLAGSYILTNYLNSTTAGYEELAGPTANEGKGWEPIGARHNGFTGIFDGQGYEIRDLFIERPDDNGVGLFSVVDEMGVIRNLGVVNADVSGSQRIGALIGQNQGSVVNCYSTGSVAGVQYVGGLVGVNYRQPETVPNATITGDSHSAAAIISDSYSTASVSGDRDIGGLAGSNSDIINISYSTGDVNGQSWVGGLVGYNGGTMNDCHCVGSVTGDVSVGGLVGYNECTVSNSYYNYDELLINNKNIITIGALFGEDFHEWLANDKFLDVNERLSEEDGYYMVNNVTDFEELLAVGQNRSLRFRLKNDLDLAVDANFYIPYLSGEFDGNGHKISNLSFSFAFVSSVGLFGYLAPGGKITDLAAENVNIIGTSRVGGLVGTNWQGTVSNCYSTGNVTGTGTRFNYIYEAGVGGLVGANWEGTVSDSYSITSVSGKASVGGLVGFNYNYQGGVSNSHFTGSVVGIHRVGGLVGTNIFGTVNNSYSTGSVTGDAATGGLVGGGVGGTVSNSYSTGSVTGNWSVGGLVGGSDVIVSNSYSTGSVTGNSSVGGLVGTANENYVHNSFWDTETSGQATSGGGTGKTTAEMMDIATFTDTATEGLDEPWDITTVVNSSTRNLAYIWNIVDDETYPFLSWQS